jgi:hypothetical protein
MAQKLNRTHRPSIRQTEYVYTTFPTPQNLYSEQMKSYQEVTPGLHK